jgi:hypothetical protein
MKTPPAESYRYNNQPPASHPTRFPDQRDQRLGWLTAAGTAVSAPRGGPWVNISDTSPVGSRLFSDKPFTSGDQTKGRR